MFATHVQFWVTLVGIAMALYPVFKVGSELFREAFPKFLIIKDAEGHTLAALSAEDVVREEPGHLRQVHEKLRQRANGPHDPGGRVAA